MKSNAKVEDLEAQMDEKEAEMAKLSERITLFS
jgi:hypothetical protein